MIELIPELQENVIGFRGRGKVTGEDYEQVLIPAVESHLKDYDKIRILYHLGEDFEGYDAAAVWDDAKVGLAHLTSWERIAFVSDNHLLAASVRGMGFLMPATVKVFSNSELENAIAWIQS